MLTLSTFVRTKTSTESSDELVDSSASERKYPKYHQNQAQNLKTTFHKHTCTRGSWVGVLRASMVQWQPSKWPLTLGVSSHNLQRPS
eukprot:2252516-Amphidinium_carterae.1